MGGPQVPSHMKDSPPREREFGDTARLPVRHRLMVLADNVPT